MDILRYGSLSYVITILIPIILVVLFYFLFKKTSIKFKKNFILFFMGINFFQHFLKMYFWYPLYHGRVELLEITFCNICATSIILSPIIFLSKNKYFKDAIFYFGTFGGIGSLIVPYYLIDKSVFSWDYIRFFTCHAILFVTSVLTILWGLHHIELNRCWSTGLIFILFETIVFVDNLVIGYLTNGFDILKSYMTFYNSNPLWISHPPIPEDAAGAIFVFFKLDFLIYNPDKTYIPVLYSAAPLYIVITMVSAFLNSLLNKLGVSEPLDKKEFRYN